MRRYLMTTVVNMRDLGGYPIGPNAFTQYGRLIRSDAPVNLSEDESQLLKSKKIDTVIDLRTQEEVVKAPSFFYQKEGFHYYHQRMNHDGRKIKSEEEMPLSYMELIEDRKNIQGIMKIIADSPNGVLFHCTAGKDRTGVIAALLLSLAGVPASDVIADYQISYTYLYRILPLLFYEYPDSPVYLGQSKPEYIVKFFKLFSEKYHTPSEYLLDIGLSNSQISRIRNKLIL